MQKDNLTVADMPKGIDCAVGYLLGVKLIIDMFPAYRVFDYVILACSIILLFVSVGRGGNLRLSPIDALVALTLLIITGNALIDSDGAIVAIKMASAYLMYYLGRLCWTSFDHAISCIWRSMCIVVLTNALLFVSGSGFQLWGHSSTFSGMYYFKTDLASAMCLAMVLCLFWKQGNIKLRALVMIASFCLLLLSNSRMYLIILVVLIALYCAKVANRKIGLMTLLVIAFALIVSLLMLRVLGDSALFRHMGFLSLEFDSLGDLFNGENTQGRNVLFSEQIRMVAEGSALNLLFGNGFSGGGVLVNGVVYGQHSLYIGTLYNIGIAGVICSMAVLFAAILISGRHNNISRSYFLLALLAMYLLAGLSSDVAQYTANTWVPYFVIGCMVSFSIGRSESSKKVISELSSGAGRFKCRFECKGEV